MIKLAIIIHSRKLGKPEIHPELKQNLMEKSECFAAQ